MIIYTALTGSHMWQMNNEHSDLDYGNIFLEDTVKILSGHRIRDTKPCIHTDTIDHQFTEIGHVINLLLKGNTNMIHLLTSPLVVLTPDDRTLYYLIMSVRNYISFTPVLNVWQSANGLSISQQTDAVKRAKVRDPQKSLKTAFRTLTFAKLMLSDAAFNEYAPVTDTITDADIDALRNECHNLHDTNPYNIDDSYDEDYLRTLLLKMRLHVLSTDLV